MKQLKILLADDDPDDCLFFKEAIKELIPSTNFRAVHDGEQLMQLLTDKTYKLPDILFLDLNMPRKNGFECLSEIKHNKKLEDLSVVIFSTSIEQEVVNKLYHNGAQFFLRKPAEFVQFKQIIHHTLMLIKQNNISQPGREDFVITVENRLAI